MSVCWCAPVKAGPNERLRAPLTLLSAAMDDCLTHAKRTGRRLCHRASDPIGDLSACGAADLGPDDCSVAGGIAELTTAPTIALPPNASPGPAWFSGRSSVKESELVGRATSGTTTLVATRRKYRCLRL